jgi:RNA polymerase sigma-70 factor (ECF subfamily)
MNRMRDSDEALMIAVREGDVARLGVLFDRHHRALHDFFTRMTGSRTAADDLVQGVFFRMLKYRKTFRDDSRFVAWMFHIARNARADYFRKMPTEVVLSPEGLPEDSHVAPPHEEVERRQQADLLKCALLRLSMEKREALVLSRYHDMKYEEIAELMGCTVSTVKVRVHRALRELRDIFVELSGERYLCDVKKSAAGLPNT